MNDPTVSLRLIGESRTYRPGQELTGEFFVETPDPQEIKAVEIPDITDDDGSRARLICGSFWGKRGPVEGIAADPTYLDISVPPGKRKSLPVETSRHAFAYVFAGGGKFCNSSGPLAVPTEGVGWSDTAPPKEADNRSLVLFDKGDEVTVQAGDDGIRSAGPTRGTRRRQLRRGAATRGLSEQRDRPDAGRQGVPAPGRRTGCAPTSAAGRPPGA